MGIGLLILSGEVLDSQHVEELLSVKIELLGGEEGPVGGSEPAVEDDEDNSMTPGNGVVRG